MNCKQCGAEIEDGARFCGNCGAQQENKVVCKSCGAELADGAKFCGECGAQQEAAQEQMRSASTGQSAGTQISKDNKKWKICVGAKIFLVLFMFIATVTSIVTGSFETVEDSVWGVVGMIINAMFFLIPSFLIYRGKKSKVLSVIDLLTSILAILFVILFIICFIIFIIKIILVALGILKTQ